MICFQTFGATHPGVFDAERRVFTLTFRGLSFEFHADTQFQVMPDDHSADAPNILLT